MVLPRCTTEGMTLHLNEIAQAVAPGAHALVLVDQAGWHQSKRLVVPDNITLMPLPAKAPESFRGPRPEPCFDRALIPEQQRGGDLMAFNLTRGDTRPILIGLALAALLGWGLFIYAELHGAAQNQKARQQISQLSTSE